MKTDYEREVIALRDYALEQTGVSRLRWLRVTRANELAIMGAAAIFNPYVYRVSLSEQWEGLSPHKQRWDALHEIGHAVAAATARDEPFALPAFNLGARARELLSSSLLYQQAYGESFAELFALSMSLRLQGDDAVAWREIELSWGGELRSIDIAHDTVWAMRLATVKIKELQKFRGSELLGLLDAIASEAALMQVSSWHAEREALCMSGVRGVSAFLRTNGHMGITNPWLLMAPRSGDIPQELRELEAFRIDNFNRIEQLAKERGPYERMRATGLVLRSGTSLHGQAITALGLGDNLSWGQLLALREPGERRPAREALAWALDGVVFALSQEMREQCSQQAP